MPCTDSCCFLMHIYCPVSQYEKSWVMLCWVLFFFFGGRIGFVFSVHWFDCYSPLIFKNFNNCRASEHIAKKERKKINACAARHWSR